MVSSLTFSEPVFAWLLVYVYNMYRVKLIVTKKFSKNREPIPERPTGFFRTNFDKHMLYIEVYNSAAKHLR
jgi:hypothetical protein